MEQNKIVLFKKKEECCGCGACQNICPKNAIKMEPDCFGNVFPKIDVTLCVQCGRCLKACNYKVPTTGSLPLAVYAAASTDHELIKASASGGLFTVLANRVLEQGGVVFGCALDCISKGGPYVHHIMVNTYDDLSKLQGSKYVKSDIELSYREALRQLNLGKTVLFSGTPCQIDGLYGFLGQRKPDNLITADIICHGVPSEQIFRDFISQEEKHHRGKITDFQFRSKEDGWGSYTVRETFQKKSNISVHSSYGKLIPYYGLFFQGAICRENCFTCPYACSARVSDLTLGDYWGIEKMHPEYLSGKGNLSLEKGISCVLANTEKGHEILMDCVDSADIRKSNIEKVSAQNKQLQNPTKRPDIYREVMQIYSSGGYSALEHWYKKQLGIKLYLFYVWNLLPSSVKKWTKRIH